MSSEFKLTPTERPRTKPTRLYPLIVEDFLDQDNECCIVEIQDRTAKSICAGLKQFIARKELSDKIWCQRSENKVYLIKQEPR